MNKIFHRSSVTFFSGLALLSLSVSTAAQSQTTQVQVTTVVEAVPPVATFAQEKAQARKPRRPQAPQSRVTVLAGPGQVAPQVVTIVHRLSGIKMLRLLLRQGGERGVLAMDPRSMSSDAHASIIAGWALDDGKTIVTRLPQATAEIEFTQLVAPMEMNSSTAGNAASFPATTMTQRIEPDLTVITNQGRTLRARYIGLDGQTGLSVLQVFGVITPGPRRREATTPAEGQQVQLFAPEETKPEGEPEPGNIYVRVGEISAEISNVLQTETGKVERLSVRGGKLSPIIIGGVACDINGNTLGIVDAIEGDIARLVTTESIREATSRVLARQASVPRPLLGVRGEPVEFAARAAFLAHGWSENQLSQFTGKLNGILLTSVFPGTPAALAKLHAGDVIVRVNKGEVKSAEEFSFMLGQAGFGEQVEFSVWRPDSPAPVSVNVKLGGSFDPAFSWHVGGMMPWATFGGLEQLGIETVALTPKVAAQMGAVSGLLVVSVQPDSPAARSGLRERDVIESIDGRVLRRAPAFTLFGGQKKHVFSLVRDREKKQIVLESVE